MWAIFSISESGNETCAVLSEKKKIIRKPRVQTSKKLLLKKERKKAKKIEDEFFSEGNEDFDVDIKTHINPSILVMGNLDNQVADLRAQQAASPSMGYFIVLCQTNGAAPPDDIYVGFLFSEETKLFYFLDTFCSDGACYHYTDTLQELGMHYFVLDCTANTDPWHAFLADNLEYSPEKDIRGMESIDYFNYSLELTIKGAIAKDKKNYLDEESKPMYVLSPATAEELTGLGWEFLAGVYMTYTATIAVYCPVFFEIDRVLTHQLTDYWMTRVTIIKTAYDQEQAPLFEKHERFIFPIARNKVWDAEGFVDIPESDYINLANVAKPDMLYMPPGGYFGAVHQEKRNKGLERLLFGDLLRRRFWDPSRNHMRLWNWDNFNTDWIRTEAKKFEDAYYGSKTTNILLAAARALIFMRVPLGFVNSKIPRIEMTHAELDMLGGAAMDPPSEGLPYGTGSQDNPLG